VMHQVNTWNIERALDIWNLISKKTPANFKNKNLNRNETQKTKFGSRTEREKNESDILLEIIYVERKTRNFQTT